MAYITCKVVIITHINTNATILDALSKQSKDVLSDYQLQHKQRQSVKANSSAPAVCAASYLPSADTN